MPLRCHALYQDVHMSRRRRGALTVRCRMAAGRSISERRERAMDDSDDIRQLSDPDFLAERARVREAVEALQERLASLDDEFTRRAGAAWTEAVR